MVLLRLGNRRVVVVDGRKYTEKGRRIPPTPSPHKAEAPASFPSVRAHHVVDVHRLQQPRKSEVEHGRDHTDQEGPLHLYHRAAG